MPVEAKEMPKVAKGRTSKYDFTPLFDGKIYYLVRGSKEEVEAGKADFTCKPNSLRQTIYRSATDEGHKLVTRITKYEGRDAVAMQVTGPADNGSKAQGAEKPAAKR